MAPSTLFAAASLLAGVASGFYIPDFPGAVAGPGFVSIPVSSAKNNAGLRKRDDVKGTADIEIPHLKTAGYTIKISIGTPPQEVEVAVDTGSSELWVNPDCSRSSRAGKVTGTDGQEVNVGDNEWSDPEECKKRGRYEKSKSSTVKEYDLEGRTLQYGDYTTTELTYVSDTINIGGLAIKDQVFGVADKSNGTGIGIMGFGPSHYGFNDTLPYPLILASMAEQGVISSPVFSLNLRDFDNSTGSLIFGGIDTKRYTGDLVKIPFEKFPRPQPNGAAEPFQDTSYYLTVKSMDLTKPDGTTKSYPLPDTGFAVSLDCGSGANILPTGLSSSLCTDLNGEVIATDSCVVDCNLRTQPGGVKFGLNGRDITVPYRNLITEQVNEGQRSTCFLASTESEHITPGILGAPFLRSAYAVFDWGNENLHIAQAADCGSSIRAIGKGVDAVPGGRGECKSNGVAESFGVREVGSLVVALGVALVSGFALL